MKVEIKVKELLSAVKILKGSVDIKSKHPRCSILLVTFGPLVSLETTNLTTTSRIELTSSEIMSGRENVSEGYSIAIPFKDFDLGLKSFQKTNKGVNNIELELNTSDNTLRIFNLTYNYFIPEYSSLVAENKFKKAVVADSARLLENLELTYSATSWDETRPFLMAFYFDKKSSELVSTDGYRLHKVKSSLDFSAIDPENDRGGILIPNESYDSLKAFLKQSLKIEVQVNNSFARFKNDFTTIDVRLCTREYLKYAAVIPRKVECKIYSNIDLFLDVIEKELAQNKLKHPEAKAKQTTLALEITENSFKMGDSIINQNNDIKKDITIGFNGKFLIDSLKALKLLGAKEVEIGINNELSPVSFKTNDIKKEFLAIVMPIKL